MGADARTAAFYGDSGAVPDDRRTVPVGTGDDPRRAAAVWAWAGNRDHLLANAFGVEWAGLYFAGCSVAGGVLPLTFWLGVVQAVSIMQIISMTQGNR